MKINLALWDRILRFLFGILLTSYAMAGGPSWAWAGLYFILSSSWGICPIYSFFKIRSLR